MMSIGRYLGRYLINTVEYNEMRKKWECQLNNVNGNIVGRSEENGSGRWSVYVNSKVLEYKVDGGVRTGVVMVPRNYIVRGSEKES